MPNIPREAIRFHVLATDYDGTIALDGAVSETTTEALERLLASGRKLVLVTGRVLPELLRALPRIELFELVVAENGALMYRPSTKVVTPLAEPPPREFIADLEQRGVAPLSVGEVILATWEPHSTVVLEAIRDRGLELQVIFNKGAVMVLPAGVNKASGLSAALRELKMSPHNVVGIGDAENDHSFLRLCELSVAVANALPGVKDEVAWVTAGGHGVGATELVDALLRDDLATIERRRPERGLEFGTDDDGDVTLAPHGGCFLICGASASGKSTVAKRIVESVRDRGYQFCIVDPEGDYDNFEGAVVIGTPEMPPALEEATQLLEDVQANGIIALTGVPLSNRPPLFVDLLTRLLQMRLRYGRPHWLVLDEAHHLMPADWQVPNALLPETLPDVLLITVHPELLSIDMLRRVTDVIAVGATAPDILARFAELRGHEMERAAAPQMPGEVLHWSAADGRCRRVHVHPPAGEHRRHTRKYAEGQLPPERSFWFRGPDNKLKLRAQNLIQFLELAEGIDDATWEFHLRRGDYSQWFRSSIKDEGLAADAEALERQGGSRAQLQKGLRAAIERRYTIAAAPPLPVRGAS
jgi:hydroxymethylpyrimidine pyrophosphatase-like HAD family hydrolase